MAGHKLPPKNTYPEPKYGPLGENHAHYAQLREYGSKRDIDLQSRIIVFGILLLSGIVALVIALVIYKGRSVYL